MNSMIKKENVNNIFEALDVAMASRGRSEELVIFGSAAIMAQGYSQSTRMTKDVDVVIPPFDNELWLISAEAGEKFGLEVGWLNTAGNVFSRNFPKGWKDRTDEVYKGKSLTVRSLGRSDLVCTKFSALCNRASNTDRVDLEGLKPTKEELEYAKNWVVGLNKEIEPIANKMIKGFLEKGKGRGR